MMPTPASARSARLLAVAGLLAVLLLVAGPGASPARATVPPSDCGTLTVKGKRFWVKADGLRCADARRHTRRYLGARRRPTGYRCRNYTGSTKLRFRCTRGVRVFFAIRR